jgi:hypothetical protein
LYNVRFTASVPPVTGRGQLDLGRAPANATGFQGDSLAVIGIKVPGGCLADVGSAGGATGPDGLLDNNDFVAFITAFFNNDFMTADIGRTGGVAGPDNALDNNDFIAFIDAYFAGCGF